VLEQVWNCAGKVAVDDGITIRLQTTSFSSFSYEQNFYVVDAARPTPDLKLLRKNNAFVRKFNPNLYD